MHPLLLFTAIGAVLLASLSYSTGIVVSNACTNARCELEAKCHVGFNGTYSCQCIQSCPPSGEEVCGTNGLTYGSRCHYEMERCKNKLKDLAIAHSGPCDDGCALKGCAPFSQCVDEDIDEAKCECRTMCPAIYQPVCGSNGITYPSTCDFERTVCTENLVGVTLAHTGSCMQLESPCKSNPCLYNRQCTPVSNEPGYVCTCVDAPCPVNIRYDPICGTDGQTYPGECEMMKQACKSKQNITMAYRGECTHENSCKDITCEFHGVCAQAANGSYTCMCNTACPENWAPLCGSDGKTYGNDCEMKAASCRTQRAITVNHIGECRIGTCATVKCGYYATCQDTADGGHTCSCDSACHALYSPVCGSNGKTYNTACEMRHESCRNHTMITIKHLGECHEGNPEACVNMNCKFNAVCERLRNGTHRCVCNDACEDDWDPMCGSDGTTYSNHCEMKAAACKYQTSITVKHTGECRRDECAHVRCDYYGICENRESGGTACSCDFACAEVYTPVCGSDGKTYGNTCSMQSASCNAQKMITADHWGECTNNATSPTPMHPCALIFCPIGTTCVPSNDGRGECVCRPVCTKEYLPVCGSDGITYPNECGIQCKLQTGVAIVHQGVCKGNSTKPTPTTMDPCIAAICPFGKVCVTSVDGTAECICQRVCTREFLPVCGSDGVTYPNQCEIQCKIETGVTILHQGPCGVHQPNVHGTIRLPDFHSPRFLDNSCLRVIVFDDRLADAPAVTVGESIIRINRHHNPREALVYTVPLDASTGSQYYGVSAVINVNWCSNGDRDWVRAGDYLTTEAYHVDLSDNTPEQLNLQLEHYAGVSTCNEKIPCADGSHCVESNGGKLSCVSCEKVCPHIYKPVCGTDGVTYSSECVAKAKNDCIRKPVLVHYEGPCVEDGGHGRHHGHDDDDDEKKANFVWIGIIVLATICLLATLIVAITHFTKKKRLYDAEQQEKKLPQKLPPVDSNC